MTKVWIPTDTIVGDAATGNKYVRRPYINEAFWQEILKGNHVLLVAPRRVGKTSIMKDIAANVPSGFVVIYEDIEAESTSNGLYKRVFEMILRSLTTNAKYAKKVVSWMKKYSIKSIGTDGISIGKADIDYRIELNNIIKDLEKIEVKILLLIDELPEVLNTMRKSGRSSEAIEILHTLREFNQNELYKKVSIVYAGSIGMTHIVQAVGARLATINHLKPINIGALTTDEADQLIKQITSDATVGYSEDVRPYMYEKIHFLLPFFLQIMAEEIDTIARSQNQVEITNDIVDDAFSNVISQTHHFADWQKRLRDYFSKEEYHFLKYLLSHCAHKGPISIQEVYNIGRKRGIEEDDFIDALDVLKRDGYLKVIKENIYDFTSPFLKAFWLKRYPIYDNK